MSQLSFLPWRNKWRIENRIFIKEVGRLVCEVAFLCNTHYCSWEATLSDGPLSSPCACVAVHFGSWAILMTLYVRWEYFFLAAHFARLEAQTSIFSKEAWIKNPTITWVCLLLWDKSDSVALKQARVQAAKPNMAVKLCRGVEKQRQFTVPLPLELLRGPHGRSSLLQKEPTGTVDVHKGWCTEEHFRRKWSGGSYFYILGLSVAHQGVLSVNSHQLRWATGLGFSKGMRMEFSHSLSGRKCWITDQESCRIPEGLYVC